jgi:predicted Zn finger-like uncharacterized protein
MIIQCPSCATNFFLDERKFGGSPKKLKCSRCSIIWTSGSNGKPIDVPKLYEPASSQGIKQNTRETKVIDKNIKPDHPLPVPFDKPKSNRSNIFLWFSFILIFILFVTAWNKRVIFINQFPIFSPIIELFDPSIKFRGIEISNLQSRIDSGENGSILIVSGSLINQEKYLRRVPSLIIVIEDNRGATLLKEVIKSENDFFDYQEIKDFKVKFTNYPSNASNIFIEILN